MSISAARPPLILPSNPPPKPSEGEEPRHDYRELSVALGNAPLLYRPAGIVSDMRQAVSAWRCRSAVGAYVSLSERVGLPLSLLLGGQSRIPHVLVAHNLTSKRKRRFQARTGWLARFSRIVALCREQERYLVNEAGIPPERVRFLYDKVDASFFTSTRDHNYVIAGGGNILSVGLERRDYATLFAAARLLPDQRFTVVADSLWYKGDRNFNEMQVRVIQLAPFALRGRRQRSVSSCNFDCFAWEFVRDSSLSSRNGQNGTPGDKPSNLHFRGLNDPAMQIPENVRIERGLSFVELRAQYAAACLVVVPLEAGARSAAGVNAVLEAMAMGKALIVTSTPGIADYVDHTVNACAVPPADPAALAAAIRAQISDSAAAARLGANARAEIDGGRNMDSYVAALAAVVREAIEEAA